MIEVDELQVCTWCGVLFSKKATTQPGKKCPTVNPIILKKLKLYKTRIEAK